MSDFIADFKAVLEGSWATLPQEGTTTHAQAKQDLEALSKDMSAIDVALKARSINLTGAEIEKIKPEIIAYCRTQLKTAYTFKNLSSPFSSLDGISVLTTIQTIQTQFVELMGQCALRLPQTEIDLPGYGKFFVYVLQTITKPYHQYLAKVVPPTIPQSVIQEIESAADAAVLNAVAGLPI